MSLQRCPVRCEEQFGQYTEWCCGGCCPSASGCGCGASRYVVDGCCGCIMKKISREFTSAVVCSISGLISTILCHGASPVSASAASRTYTFFQSVYKARGLLGSDIGIDCFPSFFLSMLVLCAERRTRRWFRASGPSSPPFAGARGAPV